MTHECITKEDLELLAPEVREMVLAYQSWIDVSRISQALITSQKELATSKARVEELEEQYVLLNNSQHEARLESASLKAELISICIVSKIPNTHQQYKCSICKKADENVAWFPDEERARHLRRGEIRD